MRLIQGIVLLLVLFASIPLCAAGDYPYRSDYPGVRTVELAELQAGYTDGTWILVDVRSDMEFKTIHPRGAFHVSLSSADFAANLKKLADRFPGKKIALYCNGVTCIKSYLAAMEAEKAGISDVYAFDAGVPAWVKSWPAQTLLLGREVVDPEKQIISADEFKKHLLDFKTFRQMAGEAANGVVIDARDPIQSTRKLPGFEKAMPIPLDKLIRNVIARGYMKNKQLFIFDQVGRQVKWLMYYLVDQGYTDYYFLAGGATAVLQEQEYR